MDVRFVLTSLFFVLTEIIFSMMLASSSGGSCRRETHINQKVLLFGFEIWVFEFEFGSVPNLCLPGQGSGVECCNATGTKNSDCFSVIIHYFKVQILVILPPLNLASWTPFLKKRSKKKRRRRDDGWMRERKLMGVGLIIYGGCFSDTVANE